MLFENLFKHIGSEAIDFDRLKTSLKENRNVELLFQDIEAHEANIFIKLLLDFEKYDLLADIFEHFLSLQIDFNKNLIPLTLIKLKNIKNPSDFILFSFEIDTDPKNLLCLLPHLPILPENLKKQVEAALQKRRDDVEDFRLELLDQVEFLNNQFLTEKATEIQNKIQFHFPQNKEAQNTKKQNFYKKNPNDLKYSKIIEQSLSKDLRSRTRNKGAARFEQIKKEDTKVLDNLANIWLSEFNDIELLLTQLEFLNYSSPHFYKKILDRDDLSVWTKAYLYIKSQNYFEGLSFLDSIESNILANVSNIDSAENIYNFYYTKGIMLLGAGMTKEAEEIFLNIKEQDENFRDINILLQSIK